MIEEIDIETSSYIIRGHIDVRFKKVLIAFEKNYGMEYEDASQLCIYYQGEKVIDVYGCIKKPDRNYGPSYLQNIYSSGKVIESLIACMLVDRGLIDYDQVVSSIWREFSNGNKGDITLGHIMRHQSGISRLGEVVPASQLTQEEIKKNSLGKRIENQVKWVAAGKRNQYHSFTRGWLLGEIVRRVDKDKRTISRFLEEEIAIPLGGKDEITIGLPLHLRDKHSRLQIASYTKTWLSTWLFESCGGKDLPFQSWSQRMSLFFILPWVILGLSIYQVFCCCWKTYIYAEVELEEGYSLANNVELLNDPEWLSAEISSVNIHATARQLAKIGAMIVNGGEWEGKRLVSSKGIEKAYQGVVESTMFNSGTIYQFTQAGWNLYESNRLGFIGWTGTGGSILQWNREYQLVVAYTPNVLEITENAQRGYVFQKMALECIKVV